MQLQVEAVADAPRTLTLDTRGLTIHSVRLLSGAPAAAAVTEEKGAAAQSLQHVLADAHEVSWPGPGGPVQLLAGHLPCA